VLGNRLLEGNPVKGTLAHQLQSTLPHAYQPPTTDSKYVLDRRRESWAKHKLPSQSVTMQRANRCTQATAIHSNAVSVACVHALLCMQRAFPARLYARQQYSESLYEQSCGSHCQPNQFLGGAEMFLTVKSMCQPVATTTPHHHTTMNTGV
jgi:hypothetical protein